MPEKKRAAPRGEPALMPYRFERLAASTVITNDFGGWLSLKPAEFESLRRGSFARNRTLLAGLEAGGFLAGRLDFDGLARSAAGLNASAWSGPSLHILVVTLECNHACVYCRAARSGAHAGARMTLATAKRSVDLAFSSPSPDIAIEFQGGEALVNWPVVLGAVLYALKKNKTARKNLSLSVVTNLSLMDEAKLAFLVARGVAVCTSLDGPADLHDANRRYAGGSSYAAAAHWLKKAAAAQRGGGRDSLPSALMTTTRQSLGRAEEIIETYRALGLGGVFLRPLSPIGYAKSVWGEIGYAPAEFAAFYRRALRRIMEINRGGERFVERNAAMIARKALLKKDPGYLDLRSPCGAAIGQLAYNWDGGVYTCDEGRMTGAGGDDFFRLGGVYENSFAELVSAPAARVCAMASCLENQPACCRCAWKPYCGVCPVHNYETQGSPWGDIAAGTWCAVQKGIFAAVFEELARPGGRRIMEGWLEPR